MSKQTRQNRAREAQIMKKKAKSSAIAQAIDEAVFNKVNADEDGIDENEETQAKVVEDDDDDDDIFQQDFSKQEKPSKLRILNANGLDRDQKYKGKKVSRKSLQSFDQSSDDDNNDEIDSESEEEAMEAEEHEKAELGHMFEMEGVEYKEEDEPGPRKNRGKYTDTLVNDHDSDFSGGQEEELLEEDFENEESDQEDSNEEDVDAERIKSMIMKSKMAEGSSSDEESGEKLEEQSDDGSEDNNSNEDINEEESGTSDDDEDVDDEEQEEDEEDVDDEEMGFDLSTPPHKSTGDEVAFDTFKQVDVDREISKGQAIKAQLQLWDNMVELRIALQKSLVKTNQLPSTDQWPLFKSAALDNDSDLPKRCQSNLAKILDCLTEMRNHLLETNSSVSISDNLPKKLPRKRKIVDYEEDLEWYERSLKKWKNDTLEDWNDRTRITGTKKNDFAGFETSVTRQIEHILADKKRLIKRTQLKRFAGDVLGHQDTTEQEYYEEIFDDDDFYHQLLRDLIERKTSDVTDPIALGQQWLQLQKLRAKVKKKVDTKASKGRKTRFDIHAKLVNFMAPTYPSSTISDEAKNELFASLFKDQQQSNKT